jgi:hypothetical protein
MKGWFPSDTLSARLLANAIVWIVMATDLGRPAFSLKFS